MRKKDKLKVIEEAIKRLLDDKNKNLIKEEITFEQEVGENNVMVKNDGTAQLSVIHDKLGLSVSIYSWDSTRTDDKPGLAVLKQLIGHKVRITIDVVD